MDSISDEKTDPNFSPNASPVDAPGDAALLTEPAGLIVQEPPSRLKKTLKTTAWVVFAVACMVVFTIIKLPETKVKNYIQGSISSALAAKGIGFSSESAALSFGLGISYEMRKVTLTPPPPSAPIKIDSIEFSPSFLSLLLGKLGGKVWIANGDGRLKGSFSVKNDDVSVSLKASSIDLGKLGVLAVAAGIQGSLELDGDAAFSGNVSSPATWNGDVKLEIKKLVLDQQPIYGFSVPKLTVSGGTIELSAGNSKATIKTFKLGKPGSQDDIIATASGSLMLGKIWDSTTLDVKAKFNLSEKVLKAFILIDALMGPAKQADGSYAYQLTGPLNNINPVPLKQ